MRSVPSRAGRLWCETSGQNVYVGLGALDKTPHVNADEMVLIDPEGQVASTYPAR